MRTIFAGAAACVALLAAGCGDGDARAQSAPVQRSITLAFRFDDGAGKLSRGTLTCRPGVRRATGIARPASTSCPRVRAIAALLTTQPRRDRVCTLIFGGPQAVRATGAIDGKRVARSFSRSDGCKITDYDRLAGALPAIRVK